MNTMNKVVLLSSAMLTFAVISCGGNETNEIEAQIPKPDTETVAISKEEIQELIASFPTPVETALIIKGSNHELKAEELLPNAAKDKFVSSYQQALALGGYAADMGFLNMYERVDIIPDYLKMVRSMAKELHLITFFDFDNLIELSKQSENIDELILSTTESFNQMEDYLREQGRDEISLMIVFGTWLEGAYLYANIAKDSDSEDMRNRIIEQKEFVMQLSNLFGKSQDKYFQQLTNEINVLKSNYEKVGIEYVYNEPTMEEVDGQLIITDNTETIITASKEDVDSIIAETINLRNKLLK